MAGAARSKIDRQTMQMFDAEVDAPQHDNILTTLFSSDERLRAMICKIHGIGQLIPLGPNHVVPVVDWYSDQKLREISFSDAQSLMEGPPPSWRTLDPIRDLKKKLEAPLYHYTQHSSRIMGFADLLLSYWIPGPLTLTTHDGKKYVWRVNQRHYHIVAEVKGKWPTAGNLLRQLNLYATCGSGANGQEIRIVVGPDNSMADLLHAHGWRLVTFDADLSKFRLCKKPDAPKRQAESANTF